MLGRQHQSHALLHVPAPDPRHHSHAPDPRRHSHVLSGVSHFVFSTGQTTTIHDQWRRGCHAQWYQHASHWGKNIPIETNNILVTRIRIGKKIAFGIDL